MRRLPPESSLGLDKRNGRRNRGVLVEFLEKGRAKWEMAATSLHDDFIFFLILKNVTSGRSIADVDTLVGSYEGF